MSDLYKPDIEGIYELNLPLEFRLKVFFTIFLFIKHNDADFPAQLFISCKLPLIIIIILY